MSLEFERITGGYGDGIVVQGAGGSVDAGCVLAVVGRNGVGKSTLLKLIAGHLRCRDGVVRLSGEDVTTLAPERRHRRGLTYCPQERPVFDDLSVRDNLLLMRKSRSLEPFQGFFERFPRLPERLRQHAGTLSGGEKKILSLVRGLSEQSPVTLIDEPTEGVQPENIEHMRALIADRKRAGGAFVIVEQNLGFIEQVADHYLVMDHGSVVLSGTPADLSRETILHHLRI